MRLRDATQRRRQSQILIDGIREVGRALDGGVNLLEVFVEESNLSTTVSQDISKLLGRLPRELLQPVTPSIMQKLSYGQRQSEIVCVAQSPALELSRLPIAVENSLWLVIDRIEKPGNLGAILRSADAAGVSAVLLADPACDVFNPNAIRASLGTIFTVPLASADSHAIVNYLHHAGCKIFAARVEASKPYWDAVFTSSSAIVLGCEATGLGDNWRGESIENISIPMSGSADSLNLSVSASILMFEAIRQRCRAQR